MEEKRGRRCALEGYSKREEQQAPDVLEHSSVPVPQETLQQVTSVWWVCTGLGALPEEKHS